jgi:hypothetical protein
LSEDLRIACDIDGVPNGSNCAVIIRHADRGGPLNEVVRRDERLNETGIRRAENLGAILRRFHEMRSFSSPIDRCKETCKHISSGYGKNSEPTVTELLGMLSPTMVDPKLAYQKMNEVGLLGFVDLYVKDSIDKCIAIPCSEGAKLLFSYVIEKIRPMKNGVGVFVTHDMIITPPMAYYFGYDFIENGLVPFLDGVVLYQEGDEFVARYDGREIQVDGIGVPSKERA